MPRKPNGRRPLAESCRVCGGSLAHRMARTAIYCSVDCQLAAVKARRPPLPETDYTDAMRRDPCAFCGARGGLALDHIEPLAQGGSNSEDNLTAACKPCNSSKNDDRLLLFLLRR